MASPILASRALADILYRADDGDTVVLVTAAPYRIISRRGMCAIGSLLLGADVVRAFHEECLAEAGLDALQAVRNLDYRVRLQNREWQAAFRTRGHRCCLRLRPMQPAGAECRPMIR